MTTKAKRVERPSLTELQAIVRGAGLRSTGARIAVLEYFHARGGQNTHADLFDALGDGGFDRATIYRVLIDLSEAKILSRSDVGDHVWRFELTRGVDGVSHGQEHPHFVCVDCGTVSCLPGLKIKVVGSTKAPKAVRKQLVAVQLKGRCDACG